MFGLIKRVVSLYRGTGTRQLEDFLLKITLNGPNFSKMVFNGAGKIVKTGGKELALKLEEKGYGWLDS